MAAVTRLGVAQVPGPDLILQDGDTVHVAVGGDEIGAFDERLAAAPVAGGPR